MSLLPASENTGRTRHVNLFIVLSLVAALLFVYWQVQYQQFIIYDEEIYVTDNPQVSEGLTWESLRYAFTESKSGYWHPLTWLSLMADRQLFRDNAGGYHWTSLLLHIANTVLLFFVLLAMTKAPIRSGFAAALFAFHPLHVEAVAWVGARKEVLSGFFWILTLGAYAFYVRKPSVYRYLLIIPAFILGLMSKPSVIMLPAVLLLLDYWPLQRVTVRGSGATAGSFGGGPDGGGGSHASPLFLLGEKIPLAVVGGVIALISIFPAGAANTLVSLRTVPVLNRLWHASIAYLEYLIKTFWPLNLAAFYPSPPQLSLSRIVTAVCVLLSLSILVFLARKKRPYLIVGWLWYLISLLPVIGLIQVWTHETADRYTYLPLVGIFIMISWGLPAAVPSRPRSRAILFLFAGACLAAITALSWRQVSYWQDSYTLWSHTIAVTDRNSVAHNNLGLFLARNGRRAEAAEQYRQAIRLNPNHYASYSNLGIVLAEQGEHHEATLLFLKALSLKADYADARNNLGITMALQGRYPEALNHILEAIRLQPDRAQFQFNAGRIYFLLGNRRSARQHLVQCLVLDKRFEDAGRLLALLDARMENGKDDPSRGAGETRGANK